MNINLGMGDNTLQNPMFNIQPDAASGKTDGQQIVSGNIADIRELVPGQMFEGNVADINDTIAKIILNDNTVLNATLQEDVNINIGDNVTFVVKDNSAGKIVLKPVIAPDINDRFIDKVLNATGISVSSSHKDIVNELMKQGQPVDRQTILNVIKANIKYPDTPVSDVVTMNRYGIPLTDENVEMYSAFIKNEGKISEYVKNVVDDIPDMILGSYENAGREQTLNFIERILNVFTDGDGKVTDVKPEAGNIIADNTNLQDDTEYRENVTYTVDTKNIENKNNGDIASEDHIEQSIAKEPVSLKEKVQTNEQTNEQVQTNEQDQVTSQNKIILDTDKLQPLKDEVNEGDKNIVEELKDTMDKLVNITENDIKEGENNNTDSLKGKIISLLNELPDKEAEKFIKSDTFLTAVKDTVKSRLFLKPDKIILSDDSKKYIKEALVKIEKQMKELSDIVKNSVSVREIDEKSAKTVLNDIKNTGGNMNFMNEFNSHVASYIQIPVKFSNEETAGELYIYNKNKKVTAEDGITAFLHFDLESLGATDIRIKLKGKGLSLSFELADEKSVKIVNEHFDRLEEKLKEKGYRVNYSVTEKKRENKSVIKDIMDSETSGTIKRYTFDIRT